MYAIQQHVSRQVAPPRPPEKETIHSGQFMVSHFEAEEQDDEDNVAVPIPEESSDVKPFVPVRTTNTPNSLHDKRNQQPLAIDTSLAKLFQCMSLAYRQKLTSPKWNRFRGIQLKWKDKIRLNNVIWRCWHLQFIRKERTLVCQFASPLDVDTHNKPEAVVLEGKYWKRKLAACTAEYKRWRMFYRNNILGHMPKDHMEMLNEMDLLVFDTNSSDNMSMMVDEDYMGLMTDTLFSTITNQPYVFPDSREIAKAGLADFIQPSLGPLQPNLDDYMDIDPLQELINTRLPTVPEEHQSQQQSQEISWGYLDNSPANESLEVSNITAASVQTNHFQVSPIQQIPKQENIQNSQVAYNNLMLQPNVQYIQQTPPPSSYPSVISKSNSKPVKNVIQTAIKQELAYSKSMENVYTNYVQSTMANSIDGILQDTSQQSQVQIQDMQQYKLVQASQQQQKQLQRQQQQQVQQQQQPQREASQGYKFPVPGLPKIKFTSQHQQKESKPEPRQRGAHRGKARSRSNTREPIKRPPLLSAVSDPSLLTTQTSSLLLTQLLTNSSTDTNVLYSQNRTLNQEMISNSVSIKKEDVSPVNILPQGSSTTLIIPQVINAQSGSTPDPLLLNTFSNSNSPIMDPLAQNIHSPTSSQGSIGSPSGENSHKDRRVGHIHAEQKRRYNIKNGFDMIQSLIPHLNQNPNAKLSKAAMLQKGAEYIRELKYERQQLKEEMESLRQQIETLNTSISNCQSMLPATGAPVSRRRDSKMKEMFEEYVQARTMENWKFWIFSLIFKPLLNSFNNFVSTSSLDDLYSSTMHWIEQHCTLVDLRPVVLNSLRYLCTKTEILSDPDRLPEEAREIVLESGSSSSSASGGAGHCSQNN